MKHARIGSRKILKGSYIARGEVDFAALGLAWSRALAHIISCRRTHPRRLSTTTPGSVNPDGQNPGAHAACSCL
jgi:hypothetical protein